MTEFLFAVSLALLAYTWLGYPLALWALSRRARPRAPLDGPLPFVSLVIPAHDEEAILAEKLENTRALDYPADLLEVVVAADGSSDGTAGIARAHGVVTLHRPFREGKASALNRASAVARGDVLVLTDANAMLSRGALRALVAHLADPGVGVVAGEKRVAGSGEGLYWRYESAVKRLEGRVGSVMGAAGELLAVRREAFRPLPPDSIVDDFHLSMRALADGWRVAYEPAAVALEPPAAGLLDDFERRARITAGGWQSMARLPELLDPRRGLACWQYVSHRVLRWAVAPFMLVAAAALGLLLAASHPLIGALQVAFYALCALGALDARGGRRRGWTAAPFHFCLANAAALVGAWRFWSGGQPAAWRRVR